MTTLVGGCQLEISPAIEPDTALVGAIRDGMGFLADRPGFCSADLTASWRYSHESADRLVFALSESDGDVQIVGSREIPVADIYNPVYRDIWVSRVWGDFLSRRLDRNQIRIRGLLDQLLEEGEGARAEVDGHLARHEHGAAT